MSHPELEAFEAAAAAMLGALDGLVALSKREAWVGLLPPRSVEIRTQILRREIEGLYEPVFQGSVDDQSGADAEIALCLGPARAEDFDHFPPNRKNQS